MLEIHDGLALWLMAEAARRGMTVTALVHEIVVDYCRRHAVPLPENLAPEKTDDPEPELGSSKNALFGRPEIM